jgi:phospho-N-acetylmuramoyl-pentapeptide-transferase
MNVDIVNLVKVIAPTAIAFFIGIAITPAVSGYLYRNSMWKKKAGKRSVDGKETPIFNELHKEREVGTPKMGGVIIWGSVLLTILAIWLISELFPTAITIKLDFLSGEAGRGQTWLPLFTLVVGALIGLVDDYFEVTGKSDYFAGGLSLKKRLLVVFLVSLVGAYWFYIKLGVSEVMVPFFGLVGIGWWFVPFFILIMLGIYAGGVIDGIDGLAGGVFMSSYAAYGVIAFSQNQINLAAFCFVVVGGILAFLWFNIPPARFYMAETGSMSLTMTLAVVAFLTGEELLLPIIAFPIVITTLSDVIQLTSKKLRNGKKVFLVAPIHHHFEVIGWPPYKVTMRYWVISIVLSIVGLIIALVG